MPLSANDYQEFTAETALYPEAGTGSVNELMYAALGLSGEAGEIANNIKKLYRDGDNDALRDKTKKELGDVLWYAARLATALDITLSDAMETNKAKLLSRKERGVIGGSGDDR